MYRTEREVSATPAQVFYARPPFGACPRPLPHNFPVDGLCICAHSCMPRVPCVKRALRRRHSTTISAMTQTGTLAHRSLILCAHVIAIMRASHVPAPQQRVCIECVRPCLPLGRVRARPTSPHSHVGAGIDSVCLHRPETIQAYFRSIRSGLREKAFE